MLESTEGGGGGGGLAAVLKPDGVVKDGSLDFYSLFFLLLDVFEGPLLKQLTGQNGTLERGFYE